MTSKKDKIQIDELESILQSALEFGSDVEKLKFETEMLHLDTMKVIEVLMKQKRMNKKELAHKLGVSQSFITQLFTAEKLINYKILAKLQRIFETKFSLDTTSWQSYSFDDISNLFPFECKVIFISDYRKDKNDKAYTIHSADAIAIGY